jgi:hypothetical protein
MPFDLKAATEAAQSEAQREPFEFDWGEDHFSIAPMGSWPLSVSATFAAFGAADSGEIDPQDVMLCLRQIVGEDQWDRFIAVVPLDAMSVLIDEMSKEQFGEAMPGLSPRQEPVSIQT